MPSIPHSIHTPFRHDNYHSIYVYPILSANPAPFPPILSANPAPFPPPFCPANPFPSTPHRPTYRHCPRGAPMPPAPLGGDWGTSPSAAPWGTAGQRPPAPQAPTHPVQPCTYCGCQWDLRMHGRGWRLWRTGRGLGGALCWVRTVWILASPWQWVRVGGACKRKRPSRRYMAGHASTPRVVTWRGMQAQAPLASLHGG